MSIIDYGELMQHMPNILLAIGWGAIFCFVTYLLNDTDTCGSSNCCSHRISAR